MLFIGEKRNRGNHILESPANEFYFQDCESEDMIGSRKGYQNITFYRSSFDPHAKRIWVGSFFYQIWVLLSL